MDNCIFCRIIAGEIPSMRVYEDECCIAMLDINPAGPGHTLILPKQHFQDITAVDDATVGHLFSVARKIGMRAEFRLNADGFNIVQNNGAAAGQTVPHFHIHVIPRFSEGPDMVSWTPTEPADGALQAVLEKLTAEEDA